jgi:hypothetical protein
MMRGVEGRSQVRKEDGETSINARRGQDEDGADEDDKCDEDEAEAG